jgi:uroporphyrinogen-III synthase
MSDPARPLAGRTVLVTRPTEESERLVALLKGKGAATLVSPTIRIEPGGPGLDAALGELAAGRFDWVTLSSRATVRVLDAAMSPPELAAKVAVVGEGTGRAFRAWSGREPDLMPRVYETEALGAAFPRGRGRVLCLRADIAPPGLEAAIRQRGWRVIRVTSYRTILASRFEPEIRTALEDGGVDAVTFTSASTVRGFLRACSGPPATRPARGIRVACIGPVTAAEARTCGFRVHAVARPHTTAALAEAVERGLRRARTR